MPATVEIEVFGEQILKRHLLRAAHNVEDTREAFRAIARILRRGAEAQFATSGAYGGTPWPQLAPSTVEQKRRRGLDPRILRATGALHASLATQGAGHVEEYGPGSLRWGSDVSYGRFHMTGTSRMPARPPMRLSPQDRRLAVKELQRSIFGGVGR